VENIVINLYAKFIIITIGCEIKKRLGIKNLITTTTPITTTTTTKTRKTLETRSLVQK